MVIKKFVIVSKKVVMVSLSKLKRAQQLLWFDFYDLRKCILVIIFIEPILVYAGKNAVNDFIAHCVSYTHFVFPLSKFSFVERAYLWVVVNC